MRVFALTQATTPVVVRAAICAFLFCILGYVLAFPEISGIGGSDPGPVAKPLLSKPIDIVTRKEPSREAEQYFLQRPLFWQSRRPWIRSAPQQIVRTLEGKLEVPPPKAHLVGTVTAESEQTALIAIEPGSKIRLVHEGDQLGAWTIQQIKHSEILMIHADQHATLHFAHAQH
jgi:hypothetical protein